MEPCYLAEYGKNRPDVAAFFEETGFTYSGFDFSLPAAEVGVGAHELRLRIHVNGAPGYLETRDFPFLVE